MLSALRARAAGWRASRHSRDARAGADKLMWQEPHHRRSGTDRRRIPRMGVHFAMVTKVEADDGRPKFVTGAPFVFGKTFGCLGQEFAGDPVRSARGLARSAGVLEAASERASVRRTSARAADPVPNLCLSRAHRASRAWGGILRPSALGNLEFWPKKLRTVARRVPIAFREPGSRAAICAGAPAWIPAPVSGPPTCAGSRPDARN
jgi:hypothetical protein